MYDRHLSCGVDKHAAWQRERVYIMKLFHLSDLHLGKRLNEFSLIDDQRYIL